MRHESPAPLIRVLVSDDTRVHTELLADVLKRDGHFKVTTCTSGPEALLSRPNFNDIDTLLISSNLAEQPGKGFEILRTLQASHPDLRAIMLLDSSKAETILAAFRAGARGVFSKDESVETLNKCVQRVHEGQIWANNQQVLTLVDAVASSHNIRAVSAKGLNLLSNREMEVVRGVAQGMSNREIAERLHLSQHTIKNCLFRVFDKLGVSNRVELLFMTLSQERPSTPQHVLGRNGVENLQDGATLAACQRAADEGVLVAQLALAEFYSRRRESPSDAICAYAWFAIACEQMSRDYEDAAKALTMDQLLQAEQMIAERSQKAERASLPAADRTVDLDRDDDRRRPLVRSERSSKGASAALA